MKAQFSNTKDGRNTPYDFHINSGTIHIERKYIAERVLAENGENITIEILGKEFKSCNLYKSLSRKSWSYNIDIDRPTYEFYAGIYGIKKCTKNFTLIIDSGGFGYLSVGSSYFNFDLSKIIIK